MWREPWGTRYGPLGMSSLQFPDLLTKNTLCSLTNVVVPGWLAAPPVVKKSLQVVQQTHCQVETSKLWVTLSGFSLFSVFVFCFVLVCFSGCVLPCLFLSGVREN